MTNNDRNLIAAAEIVDNTDWYKVDLMVGQADTEEARRELHLIANRKYHMEEYGIGNL